MFSKTHLLVIGLTRCLLSPANFIPATTSPNTTQSTVPFGMGQKNTIYHSNPESELSEHSLVRRATNVNSNLEEAFSLLTSQKISQGAFIRTPSIPQMSRETSAVSGVSDHSVPHTSNSSSSGTFGSPTTSATLSPAALFGSNTGLLSQKSPVSDNNVLPPRAPTPMTRMDSSLRGLLNSSGTRRTSPIVRASSANISTLLSRKSPQPNNSTTDPQVPLYLFIFPMLILRSFPFLKPFLCNQTYNVPNLPYLQQLLLLESALHMADISNPAKPWEIYQRWLNRVMEEFYHQGRFCMVFRSVDCDVFCNLFLVLSMYLFFIVE